MPSKRQRKAKAKANIPEVPNQPMHLWPESLEPRFEDRDIDDPTTSTIIRGMAKAKKHTEQLANARTKIMKDKTLNSHAKRVEFTKFAESKSEQIFDKLHRTQKAIDERVDELNEKISTPISQEADRGRNADEIRQHVKGLEDQAARMKFTKNRIQAEDWDSASAILGSKFFLAGLDEDTRDNLRDYYKQERFSEEFKTIETFETLQEQLFTRVQNLSNYRRELKSDSVLRDIASQEERKQAMK